ncbi:hypothetical protein CYMTET_13763 [Cymbomonas tetramitiformis]|uniref:Uncharacterized protein n=1 Tax=Cymbomonas tetramitiformis TaxID=36881 RepID=A0AAE0GIV2_9CHLO|nr:hypothetical protein CYMTET_13763 [Cymbomonas tetramitiformis]
MSTGPQRARMASVRSVLISLRVHRQHFTTGYGLVVPGGACALGTSHDDNIMGNNNETFDFHDFISPLASPSSYAPLGHHVVMSGGAITPTSPFTPTIIPFDYVPFHAIAPSHRIFHLRHLPSPSSWTHSLWLVVPGRFWLWHRVGIG